MDVQVAAAFGVACAAWLLAIGFTSARGALVAHLPLGVAVIVAFPPVSVFALPVMVYFALTKLPADVRARNGGFFKQGDEGGIFPLAILAAVVSITVVVGAFYLGATRIKGLEGEPVQTFVAMGLILGGFVGGFFMSRLARRVAFLEALWVTAIASLVPGLMSGGAASLFTYGTAAAYYAVVLLTALLILGLSLILGGSLGFLFCGDGEVDTGWGYEGFIGRRFLMGKGGDVVGTITVISVLAVAVGTMAMVVVMSVMNGFSSDLRNKIFGTNAQLLVLKYGSDFVEYDDVVAKSSKVNGVAGATPFVLNEVMISAETNATGALLKGIDVDTINSVMDLGGNVQQGKLEHLKNPELIEPTKTTGDGEDVKPDDVITDAIAKAAGGVGSVPEHGAGGALPGVILGVELAKQLRVFVGDVVDIVSPVGELGPTGPIPRARAFRVAATFYSGMFEYDSKFIYIDLKEAQTFFSLNGAVTGIEYKLVEIDDVQSVARNILKEIGGYPYRTKDWMEMNRNLFSALKLEKIAMFIILNFIVIVASFLIAAVVIVFVIEKSKEISILKTMGATDTSIMKIFVTYGLTVGGLGTLLGIALGVGICWVIGTFGVGMDPTVYYIANLPVKVESFEVFLVGVAALGLSYLATIYPALLAARLKPVEGLRYE